MSAVSVKICGINSEISFDAAVEAGADWVGFVFFPPSPRFVTPARAALISSRHNGGPPRVGLFVQPTEADIAATLEALSLDILQVYAPAKRALALRRRFGRTVWRAVGVALSTDLPNEPTGADALLIEAKASGEATRPGGNRERFDWSLLKGWRAPLPWILAGGLDPKNVARAITETGACAVDVSSGVELRPGVKDPGLIHEFIAAARSESR